MREEPITGMVVHTCKPATQKVAAGESQIEGQPGALSETSSENKKGGDVAQWYSPPGFNPW